MDIKLIANKADLNKISEIIRKQEKHEIFVDTIESNVKNLSINFSKDYFWETIVGCLLSTQQNVGQDRAVVKFSKLKPFPLCLEECKKNDLRSYTERVLSEFGGIRRYKIIG